MIDPILTVVVLFGTLALGFYMGYCTGRDDQIAKQIAYETQRLLDETECDKPPPGWRCTRAAGHDGPCAAIPEEPNL